MAKCCELMVRFYGAANEKATTTWIANARRWYQKAQAAHPNDISIARRITEFYLGAKLVAEAESQLDAILKRDAGANNDQIKAWARRTKALILASSTDPQRVRSRLGSTRAARSGRPGRRRPESSRRSRGPAGSSPGAHLRNGLSKIASGRSIS